MLNLCSDVICSGFSDVCMVFCVVVRLVVVMLVVLMECCIVVSVVLCSSVI